MRTRSEAPVPYRGKRGTRWIARYTNVDGKRVSAGTFDRKGPCKKPSPTGDCCAQHAIDAAYDRPAADADPATVGAFAETWTQRYPRAATTNVTNGYRIASVLDVDIQGRALRDWSFRELRRKHAVDLVRAMLVEQHRAAEGVRGVMRSLSAMAEDAITDEIAEVNPFRGVKVRDNDPRITKAAREPNVFTLEQMHAFAAANPRYEAMIRVLSDCGLRLGELLGLDRSDYGGDVLSLRGTAHADGSFSAGDTSTKKHVRAVPVAPSTAVLIAPRIDTLVLFPTPNGKRWQQSNFYKRVWNPARRACPEMAHARPQDFRHSWVTLMRAEGIDRADLAAIAGHSVETQDGIYLHALNRSDDAVRNAIG